MLRSRVGQAAILIVALLLIGALLWRLPALQTDSVPSRPNIILVMSDDQGWGDVGFQGDSPAVTPALDEMAEEGLVFDRFYAAAPVCSPTRGSILTGRHPYRYGIFWANTGHLPKGEPNLAQILNEEGYTTGFFGKWHLGTLTTEIKDSNRGRPGEDVHYAPPWDRGFDTVLAAEAKVPTYDPLVRPKNLDEYPGNLTFWWEPVEDADNAVHYGTHYWNEEGETVTDNMEGPDARVLMDRAVDFVDGAAEKNQPFFAVVWFHEPHLPVVSDSSDRRPFEDMDNPHHRHYWASIKAMDEQIGRMRDRLRELGIEEETMVWFASDNGPETIADDPPGSTGGLRGMKRDIYEGGIRVPGIVEWPGVIEPGQTDFAAVTSDYLPTIADLLNIDLAGDYGLDHELDGVSLMPVTENHDLERENPIGFMSRGHIALVGQQYKVIDHSGGGTWPGSPEEWELELYDLINDPGESEDLADQKPEQLQKKRKQLEAWYKSVEKESP